jgi:DDE superfamily endonuclease/Winged helix-turn helix
MVRLSRAGPVGFTVDPDGQLTAPVRTTVLRPWLKRSLRALLTSTPRAYGGCRTRGSWATLAMALKVKHGLAVSPWTVRRWRHELGWVWKRTKRVANDAEPRRVERWAQMRLYAEPWHAHEVRVLAEARAIHVWPKVGAAWLPKGRHEAVRTPGQHAKVDVAGALHLAPGEILSDLGPRKTHALCRDLLTQLARTDPAPRGTRIAVVVDHSCIHQANAVEEWLARHPRVALRWVPTDGPQANPIERVFGDGHDPCTRNHKRNRFGAVVPAVERHLRQNSPWLYQLSRLSDAPAVTVAVERLAVAQQAKLAA